MKKLFFIIILLFSFSVNAQDTTRTLDGSSDRLFDPKEFTYDQMVRAMIDSSYNSLVTDFSIDTLIFNPTPIKGNAFLSAEGIPDSSYGYWGAVDLSEARIWTMNNDSHDWFIIMEEDECKITIHYKSQDIIIDLK